MTERENELADSIAQVTALEIAIDALLRRSPEALKDLKAIVTRGVPEAPGQPQEIARFWLSERVTGHLDRIVSRAAS